MDNKFLKLILGQSLAEESSNDEPPDEETDENQTQSTKDKEQSRKEQVSDSVEQAGEAIGRAPQTYIDLRSEWEKDRIPFYFMLYSTVVCGGLLYILYIGRMKLFYGLFAVYAVTMLPVLYIYEETVLFSPDQNEYIRQQQLDQEQQATEESGSDTNTGEPDSGSNTDNQVESDEPAGN